MPLQLVHSSAQRWRLLRAALVGVFGATVAWATITLARPCRFASAVTFTTTAFVLATALLTAVFAHCRYRHLRTTLTHFVLCLIAVGFLTAIIVPGQIGAVTRSKQKRAMGEMRSLGAALEAGRPIPHSLPDPWGHPYIVSLASDGSYTILSLGECGERDRPNPSGTSGPTHLTTADIVFSNGTFLRYPEGPQE